MDTYFNCTGGGIELPAHYPQWKVEHGKMEPPNIILASLNKLMEGEFLHHVAVVIIFLLPLVFFKFFFIFYYCEKCHIAEQEDNAGPNS